MNTLSIEQFREDLAMAMAREKVTQAELGSLCNVPQGTISMFLRGKRNRLSGAVMLRLWPFVYGEGPARKPYRQDGGQA